jgi:hypothetical protein
MEPKRPLGAWKRQSCIEEFQMAEGSSGNGVLGVLVGALIVVMVGAGVLYATGNLGNGGSKTVKVELPKVGTTGAAK